MPSVSLTSFTFCRVHWRWKPSCKIHDRFYYLPSRGRRARSLFMDLRELAKHNFATNWLTSTMQRWASIWILNQVVWHGTFINECIKDVLKCLICYFFDIVQDCSRNQILFNLHTCISHLNYYMTCLLTLFLQSQDSGDLAKASLWKLISQKIDYETAWNIRSIVS